MAFAAGYSKTLLPMIVSQQLQQSMRSHLGMRCRARAQEAGGGGDCLFHSFGAVLEKMLQGGGHAAGHVSTKIPAEVWNGGRSNVVKHLRDISASRFDKWSWEDLLNYVLLALQQESSGCWQDQWFPRRLIDLLYTSVAAYE